MVAGVSSQDVASLQRESAPGTSKSNVLRLWQTVGHKFVDELRGKDLSEKDWAIVMLDGIVLSKEQTAIVAIGITSEGERHVVDFDLGSTENAEVCRGLMRRIKKRGFHCNRRLYAVLDGSVALLKLKFVVEFYDFQKRSSVNLASKGKRGHELFRMAR